MVFIIVYKELELVGKTVGALLRTYLITGILVSLPLVVTVWVLLAVFRTVDGSLGAVLAWIIGLFTGEALRIPGAGFVLTAVVLVGIGMIATNVFGRRLVEFAERILLKFPLVRPVYLGVKQIIDAFSVQKGSFREVVLVEYPRAGMYALGFVTNESGHELEARIGKPAKMIFVPTVPNPTSGFVLVVPEDQLTPLDMSTEEAFKLLLSGGLVMPEWKPADADPDGDAGASDGNGGTA